MLRPRKCSARVDAPPRVCYTCPMEKPVTYYRRYHGYDYSRGASLFITISTDPRKALFGRVENAAVVLSDETEFGRGACLALNEEIRAMALAGEGGALYWKQEGPEYTRGGA